MAKIQKSPAEQIYDRVFPTTTRHKKYPGLHTYLNEGGSIFPLVDMGESGLVKRYGMTAEDAKAFTRAANSMGIYIKRQYIEAILTGDVHKSTARAPKKKDSSGSTRSMVDGPSYERLFRTDFGSLCPPRCPGKPVVTGCLSGRTDAVDQRANRTCWRHTGGIPLA